MAVKVEFSDKLREWVGAMEDMEVSAATVHQALFAVARAYPALHMFNCEGDCAASSSSPGTGSRPRSRTRCRTATRCSFRSGPSW